MIIEGNKEKEGFDDHQRKKKENEGFDDHRRKKKEKEGFDDRRRKKKKKRKDLMIIEGKKRKGRI